MPATNKPAATPRPTRSAATPGPKKRVANARLTPAARGRAEDDARRLDRISHTLEAAQKDLASMGGSVGTGVRDLRRDVNKLLRDARRDLTKMRRAVQRDLERLQKDLTSPPRAKPAASRRAGTRSRAAQRREAGRTQKRK